MPKLKNSVISDVLRHLEFDEFCLEDFDVDFPDGGYSLVEIVFKPMPKYEFIIDEALTGGSVARALAFSDQNESKRKIRTTAKPGEYKNVESTFHENMRSAISEVSSWVSNLREDLISSKEALRSTIDELTDNFQRSIDENVLDQDEYFSDSEKEELNKKLDALQERIQSLEEKLNLSDQDTQKLQQVITSSKSNLPVYPKGVWYKTAGTKILRVMREILKSKEGREILADIAKKLLQ